MTKQTLNEYITLSVTKCKELGYFKQGAVSSGSIRWNDGHGNEIASIGLVTDLRGVPFVRLVYNYKGKTQDYVIPLRRKQSNLNPSNGFYLFVCPVTGLSARKLYLVNGRFVSRRAFVRPLYETQAYTRQEKEPPFMYLRTFEQLARVEKQPNRKRTYRGKPTAYGRKLNKLERRLSELNPWSL